MLSCVQLCETLWTVAHQAPLSMGFPRQDYWEGCHFLLQGIFLTQVSNPCLLSWQVDSLPLYHLGSTGTPSVCVIITQSCLILCNQASLSMGFSRQEYWSGLPCPPPGDLPDPEIEPRSPALQADSLPYEPPGKPVTPSMYCYFCNFLSSQIHFEFNKL